MTLSGNDTRVLQTWPLLMVSDLDRSLAFYRDGLGFTVVGRADADGKAFWCRLERGGSSLMLQQAEEDEDGAPATWGRGMGLYFVCDDADALHAELVRRGLRLPPPSTAGYGMRQFPVPDPDGYSVWFESPTERWAG